MAKKIPQLERIGEVLDKSLKRLELSSQLDQYGIWPIWNDVVGKPIARNAQPEKIRNGILFVKVSSPVWMQQLQFMKQMIADKLNQRLRSEVVKNIFFVVGRIDSDIGDDETRPARPQKQDVENSQLDETFLGLVKDSDVRQAFTRLLRSYARQKQKN
jgi:predicted nucleic acid-binding Zn ribbon protein